MKDNQGFGTIELVILIAVLVGLALMFKGFVVDYAAELMSEIESVRIDIDEMGTP